MQISHVAAECAPLVKVGGLADVTYGLSRQLALMGHTVEIILPFYKTLNKEPLLNLQVARSNFYNHRIWKATLEGIFITLIEPLGNDYFSRDEIYGEKDDILRFTTFSLIANRYLMTQRNLDLVHLHDWHTALIAMLDKKSKIPTLYTIHNLAYRGECDKKTLLFLGFAPKEIAPLKEGKSYNIMKAGILFADQVTTVSNGYAEEIIHTKMGGSLQKTLFAHQEKVHGIVNGIDPEFWNPESDPHLPYNYSYKELANKKRIKAQIQERFGLRSKKDFLASSITRLVEQKGPKMILKAIKEVLALGGSYIVLGSALDPKIEKQFLALKKTLPNRDALHLELTYDEELSHRVYAASDLFVMPSNFEPCGLGQLIALRYGTIPLVRATGGLKDTIFEDKNGFVFTEPREIKKTVGRAFSLWEKSPETWQTLVQHGMQENHSWQKSAQKYLALYEKAISLQLKGAQHTHD